MLKCQIREQEKSRCSLAYTAEGGRGRAGLKVTVDNKHPMKRSGEMREVWTHAWTSSDAWWIYAVVSEQRTL